MGTGLHQRYCEEVLGLKVPASFSGCDASEKGTGYPSAVECEPLNDVTRALLQKILSTIPHPIPNGHRLRFVGLGGRVEENGVINWLLPKLSEMTGTGAEVTELKKSAWTLLRQFIQEKP